MRLNVQSGQERTPSRSLSAQPQRLAFFHAGRNLYGKLALIDLQRHLAAKCGGDKRNGDVGRVLLLGFRLPASARPFTLPEDALEVRRSAPAAED